MAKTPNPHAYLIGKRVEIPAHFDNWMRGDRFGVVTFIRTHYEAIGPIVYVRGDKGTRTRLKVSDLLEFGKVL